ncbi:hypothetical protein HA402_014587 [Bradysia odoriphaga]|nr:hypothetical protein HA402_014587 [Bradysia odoriphaga]
MNVPQRNSIVLVLCLAFQFHYSAGEGLSLQEMLDQYKINNPTFDHVAQPTQSIGVQAPAYPYASASSDPRFDPQVSNLLATNVLQMAHDVGETLLSTRSERTEVFSPISIYGALSLLLLGSSGNTYHELLSIMGLSKDQYLINNSWKIHEEFGLLIDDIAQNMRNDAHPRAQPNWKVYGGQRSNRLRNTNDGDEYKVSVANGVFVQQGFSIRPDYQSAVLSVYKSSMKSLDFTRDGVYATKYINDWVNEKTNGKIPEIVNFFQPDTKLVLASAFYFKAMWESTFIEGATGPKDFYPDGLGTTPIKVQMMAHGGTFPFYDAVEYDCRILALPYRRNLSTMYIILPNNSSRSRLRQLQSYLTADKIEDMISKMEWKTSIILFPKMHITNKVDLKKTFEKMGLHSLFD